MRHDLFVDGKCIHIKLKKEVHSSLREKLFKRGMSMQEVFNELARLVSTNDIRLDKILDEYAKRKIQEEIERINSSKPKSRTKIGELDQDALYDLINSSESTDENR